MEQKKEFTELYNKFSPRILKLCLGYTGDAVLAEDLLQDTFISVWKNMKQFERKSDWGTWIYRIAVNTCLSYFRKKKESHVDTDHPSLLTLTDATTNKEQEIAQLYKSISRLQETDRIIISMVLEDTPYEEIAGIFSITESNLRVKIHRIKKQLTEIYNSYERF